VLEQELNKSELTKCEVQEDNEEMDHSAVHRIKPI